MESTDKAVEFPSTVTLGRGSAALAVNPLGFGCMGLTAFYGPNAVSDAEGIAVLRRAFDLGVTHFDTAQIYQRRLEDGTVLYNEDLVGKFLKTLTAEERARVTVATKFNPNFSGGIDKFDKDMFFRETELSLQRLGVDSIDLYYFHRIYPEAKVPVSVWMGAMKELVDAGKVKHVGLSEAPAHIIRKAHAVTPITAIQQEWSLFARDLEETVVPACRELGIGIISYSPIGRGFLAGQFNKEAKPDGFKATVPFMQEDNFDANMKLLDELKSIAEAKSCTTSQLCLAWVIAMGAVPIPGTRSLHHVDDNMRALQVKLTEKDVQRLGDIGNKVSGARGSAMYMSASFQARE